MKKLSFVLMMLAVPLFIMGQKTDKPNILVIWGDDIGTWNISHNNRGMMGYQTPNIDRIANEGVGFTDYYAQQSCTAGRAAFLSGSVPVRSGMTKVGLPGAKEGWQKTDVTIATVLKGRGYATGQFGKNHQGDLDEHLPTMHGFDEFVGSLYHLNAEEEPEHRDYPGDMVLADGRTFLEKFGPRGVLKCKADGKGGQTIENTGPLTKKRMETIDDETVAAAKDFIKRQVDSGEPFFCWWNGTRMHFRTHVNPESLGQSGVAQSEYHDAMINHDKNVGSILDLLDELGLAENTIVLYSTDNGPHRNSWPDAGTSPFRNEKNTGWEGAYRVPSFIRWPGKIKAGSVSNEIMSHLDWLPTLVAAAGDAQVKDKLLKGYKADGKKYKVHLDGYNFLPYMTGQEKTGPRKEFFYFSDGGDLMAMRYNNWKVHFMVQDQPGTLEIWQRQFRGLRMPYIFNLRTDPFEQATITSNTYWDWYIYHAWVMYPLGDVVGGFLKTFKEYPPRMKAGSWDMGKALEKLQTPHNK